MRALLLLLSILTACGNDSYLIVTVDARSSVHDATTLEITQTNAGTTRTDTLPLGSHAFPVTFSVSAPGRSGQLDLAITAKSDDGTVVGLGSGSTPLDATAASVQLDPADFVVNTDYADDQFLTTDFETVGFQISATTDNNWTVAFGSACTDTCSMFARRFDADGVPAHTVAAAGTNAFTLTTTPTLATAFPAIAGAATSTIAVWDYTDTLGGGTGIACRGLDATGTPTAGQLDLATDDADTVNVVPLVNGNFAVTWQIYIPNDEIHTIIAKPDCSKLTTTATPTTVSQTVGASEGPHRSAVAGNGNTVLYAWIQDGAVHVRTGSTAAAFTAAESTLVPAKAGSIIEAARVVALGQGFGVFVRFASMTPSSPGSIVMYRTTIDGQVVTNSTPTVITDQSGTDFTTGHQGFGVAARADGAMLVVWHQCDDGSAEVCDGHLDVFGRVVRPSGVPVGDPFLIPTATLGNQVDPSVVALDGAFAVAWNDASKTPPDENGTAVRARLVYPPYDDAAAILGAPCGGDLPACGTGLACATGTDNVARCYQTCTPPTCAGGGTCSPADATTYACTF
jgi:hypothetical protein